MKNFLLKTWLTMICLLFGVGTMWADSWQLVSRIAQIEAGATYLIATNNKESVYNGSINSGHLSASAGTLTGSTFTVPNDAYEVKLVATSTANTYYIQRIADSKYITATATKSGSFAQNSTSGFAWTFANDATDGLTVNGKVSGSTVYFRSYNNSSFRTYGNTSGNALFLYKKITGGSSTPTALSVPTNLSSSNVATTSATLSWDAVSNASSYTVKIGTTEYTGVNTNSYSATGLTAGTSYTWTVRAVGDGVSYSTSAYAANANFTTEAEQGGGDEPSGETETYEITPNNELWNTSYNGTATGATSLSGTSNGIGITLNKNKSGSAMYVNDTQTRAYSDYTMNFSAPTNYSITAIKFTADGNNWTGSHIADVGTMTDNKNWTGEEESVTITFKGTCRITSISVTLKSNGTSSKPTPSLSFENSIYNVTVGEGFKAPAVTNPQNVAVTYSSSVESVATVDSESGAVTIVAPGTTTITASFAGDETYNKTSASYNLVVAPAPLTTMDEIFAAATTVGSTATDCRVTFNNWVVSGVRGGNAYVTDNAGKGFIVYAKDHGFAVGDIFSGTAACKVQLYHAAAELTALTSSSEGLAVTKGGVITPVNTIELASLSGVNTGAVLLYENLQFDGEYFTDGETSLKPYDTFINLPNLVNGKNYDVTGVYVQYDETKEIAPRSEEDFELLNVLNKYIVNIETPTNGTLTIKNGETTVNSGDEVEEGTFLAIVCEEASNAYRFVKWEYKVGEGSWIEQGENPGTFVMPSANVQLRATFERIRTYNVAWSVNGEIVKSSENLQVGTEIAAPVVDDIHGKKFTGWVTTSTVVSDETPKYVTPTKVLDGVNYYEVLGEVTYYAVFATENSAGGEKTTLLSEDFSSITSGDSADPNKSGTAWKGNNNFTSVSSAYQAGGAVKLGGKSSTGSITTILLDLSSNGGAFTVEFDAKGWTTVEGQIQVTPTGCDAQTSSITATMIGDFEHVTMNFTGGQASSTIVFATTEKRAFIDNILVTTGGGATYSDYTTIVSAPEPTPVNGTLNFVATNNDGYWATFTSTDNVIFNANDVIVYTVAVKGKSVVKTAADSNSLSYVTDKTINEGWVTGYYVQAGAAVLINSVDQSVNYYYVDNDLYTPNQLTDVAIDPEYNMLRPASVAKETDGSYLFYKLAYGDWDNKTNLGFWWGAENGGAFDSKAGGVYLAVPRSAVQSNMRGFSFEPDERPTGIESISNDVVAGEIYNLQGQHINRLQQGVNIVNGRKVIR